MFVDLEFDYNSENWSFDLEYNKFHDPTGTLVLEAIGLYIPEIHMQVFGFEVENLSGVSTNEFQLSVEVDYACPSLFGSPDELWFNLDVGPVLLEPADGIPGSGNDYYNFYYISNYLFSDIKSQNTNIYKLNSNHID